MLLVLFHLTVLVINLFTIWYDQKYVELPLPADYYVNLPLKGRVMFLTVWCFILQIVYFAVSLLNDFVGTNAVSPKNPPLIRKIKDILFCMSFSVALYVSLAFWALYFYNKDYVMPPDVEANFPVFQNHVMHTFITPFIIIELYVTKRTYPSRNHGLGLTMLFNAIFIYVLFNAYFKTGIFVYPFLNVFTNTVKVIYFIISGVAMIGLYILGEKLDKSLNQSISHKSKSNLKEH